MQSVVVKETCGTYLPSAGSVLNSTNMAGLESKVSKLTNRVDELSNAFRTGVPSLTTPPGKSKFRWDVVAALITLVGFACGGVWFLHSEFSKISDHMGKIEARMGRLETAIRILSVAQGGNTKELVDEALKVAQAKLELGYAESASRILTTANKLIADDKAKKAPANHEFFADAVSKYAKLRSASHGAGPMADSAFKGILQLAEYRSALTSVPPDFHPKYEYHGPSHLYIGSMEIVNGHTLFKDTAFYGPASFTMPIDGFEFENVVFEGVTIRYNGGPVIFRNVWFVNCTFLVSDIQRATQLLEVAALGRTSATIG